MHCEPWDAMRGGVRGYKLKKIRAHLELSRLRALLALRGGLALTALHE
jgi:hypothetical protein